MPLEKVWKPNSNFYQVEEINFGPRERSNVALVQGEGGREKMTFVQ